MTDQFDGAATPENLVALTRPDPAASPVVWEQERSNPSSVISGPPRSDLPRQLPYVSFSRQELMEILKVYGRMVTAGEWRDYAIDTLDDRAVFSIFRRASEVPLYRVEKTPKLARKQGAFSVVAQTGMILKRGPELARVLRVFDKALFRIAE